MKTHELTDELVAKFVRGESKKDLKDLAYVAIALDYAEMLKVLSEKYHNDISRKDLERIRNVRAFLWKVGTKIGDYSTAEEMFADFHTVE